jgi:hypothetical protein
MSNNSVALKQLRAWGACQEAVDWFDAGKFANFSEAWQKCSRSDWMLWFLDRVGYRDDKALRLFACWCVRNTPLPNGGTTWSLLTDKRSREAVEAAERFCRGEATPEELAAACLAARAAAAAWDAARNAAWAAAGAAAEAAAEAAAGAAAWAAAWYAAEAAQANRLRHVIPMRVIRAAEPKERT